MSLKEKTTVMEMREIVADSGEFDARAQTLIRTDAFEDYPHRDIDELSRALQECDQASELVERFNTTHKTLKRWARAYGLMDDYPDNRSLAERLLATGGD